MDRVPVVRRALLADVPPLVALGWSALAVATATGVRYAIDRGEGAIPFLTYFPAVTLVSLFLGWRWGAAVSLVSGVVANRLLSAEPLLFYASVREAVLVGLFALACAALVAIGDGARRTVRELHAAQEREALRNQELLHRVKNLLATVNAMAVLTARHSRPEDFVSALTGRMEALDRATELLGVGESAPCDMQRLAETALAPFRAGDNFTVEGPPCELPRDACVPLSLALHELATNAAKYGALSRPEGRVSLAWALDGDGVLELSWRERGGPPVVPPTRRGMGSQLLRAQRGLDRVELNCPREGAECTIAIEGVARR